MTLMQVSNKGQIVIPQELREKYGIGPKDKVEIVEKNGLIIIIPIPKDPIRGSRGMLKWDKPTKEILAEMRAEEEELGEKKQRRLLKNG